MAPAIKPSVVLRFLCITWIICLAILEWWPGFGLWQPNENSVGQRVGESVLISGRIKNVESGGQSQQLTLDRLVLNQHSVDDRLLIFAPRFPKLSYGQVIQARCELKHPEPFNGFRYDRYLMAKKVYATCYINDPPLVVGESGNYFIGQLLIFRQATLHEINQIFSEPSSSLLAGLLLGADELSDDWKNNFRRTGTAHIVVASGYNVTIVLTWMLVVLTFIGLSRRRSLIFLVVGLISYVILAGSGAPIIRAAILGGTTQLSKHLGRKSSGLHLLLLVASVMLIWNPLLLLGDIGFQLSILSTLGLILIDPWLLPRLKWVTVLEIRQALSSTLAATLATLPLTIFTFGSVSLVAPVANLLILPLIPWAMISGAVALLCFHLSHSLGLMVSVIPVSLLETILIIVKALANLSFAYVVKN